jgi:hypothetical protein
MSHPNRADDDFAEEMLDDVESQSRIELEEVPPTEPSTPAVSTLKDSDDIKAKKQASLRSRDDDHQMEPRRPYPHSDQTSRASSELSERTLGSHYRPLSLEKGFSSKRQAQQTSGCNHTVPGAVAVHGIDHTSTDAEEDEDSTNWLLRTSSIRNDDAAAGGREINHRISRPGSQPEECPDSAPDSSSATEQDWWHKYRKSIAALAILLIVAIAVGVAVPLVALKADSSPGVRSTTTPAPTPAPSVAATAQLLPTETPSLAPSAAPWDLVGEAILAIGPAAPLVSLAGSGTDVAVSDNGLIQVYRFTPGTSQWSNIGPDIEGAGAQITTDGSTIVVSKQGSNIVSVLKLDDSTGSWNPVGGELMFVSGNATSLAISGDGKVIAIGSGLQILTFEMNANGVWFESALRIKEEGLPTVHLSLSYDGSVMGCGYERNGEEPYSLVYLRDTNWVIGLDIQAKGSMVSVSGDGSAFASGGHESTEWRNFNSDRFYFSPNFSMNDFELASKQVGVSLSRDGKTMATASGSQSAVWTLGESKWETIGRRVHDGPLFSISLSDDGTLIAVGVEGSVSRIEIYQRRV